MAGVVLGVEITLALVALAVLVLLAKQAARVYFWIDEHSNAAPQLLGFGLLLLVAGTVDPTSSMTIAVIGCSLLVGAAVVDVVWDLYQELAWERRERDRLLERIQALEAERDSQR